MYLLPVEVAGSPEHDHTNRLPEISLGAVVAASASDINETGWHHGRDRGVVRCLKQAVLLTPTKRSQAVLHRLHHRNESFKE